ncbi:AmmeMemoRadiSam system protein B [Patescibacteria group bacterium]
MKLTKYHLVVPLLILAAGILVGYWISTLAITDSEQQNYESASSVSTSYHYPPFGDQDYYNEAWDNVEVSEPISTQGAIIPHHLVAKELIAELLATISETNPTTIVVIGPNHMFLGRGQIITSDYDWKTPWGIMEVDREITTQLANNNLARIEPLAMAEEFSVSNEVAFLKKVFPDAKLVPLIIKDTLARHKSTELAAKLDAILPAESLIIVSADFSHETTSEVADTRDATSIEVLQNFALADIDLIEVDTKPSLRTLLTYLELRGATNWKLVNNSNSAKILNKDFPDATSYITGYFY